MLQLVGCRRIYFRFSYIQPLENVLLTVQNGLYKPQKAQNPRKRQENLKKILLHRADATNTMFQDQQMQVSQL